MFTTDVEGLLKLFRSFYFHLERPSALLPRDAMNLSTTIGGTFLSTARLHNQQVNNAHPISYRLCLYFVA